MTKQEAYDELKSYRKEMMECEHIRRRMRELKEQMSAVKISDYSEIVRGGELNRIDDLIDKIDKLSEEYFCEILKSEELRKRIKAKIERLQFPFADILKMRYIDKLSYEEMSVKMSTNYRQHYSYEYMRKQTCRGVDLYQYLKN